MELFFTFLKKGLVATVFIIFGFVATYIPHQNNNVQTVHAGAWTGGATYSTDAQLVLLNATNTTIAAAEGSIVAKEYGWDFIAWVIAKVAIKVMIDNLISWINNGFEGRPMFVEDIKGYMLEVGDQAFGTYLEEIGGLASFICAPFRLDISLALNNNYIRAREQPAPTCSLTGVIDNLEGFLDGAQGSFSQGGWNDWFDVTSSPQVYTPYGALLSADAGGQARLVNAKGDELKLLDFGAGFLSAKECRPDPGSASGKLCTVVTPGDTIAAAVNNSMGAEQEALVTADEIDELIGALIGALANKVFSSGKGLLQ